MPTPEEIEADILYKLMRKQKWQASHIAFEKLYKHAPQQFHHEYKDAAKRLIKKGLILEKPTGYGLQVSLNIQRKTEIEEIVKKFLKL